jgi:RimJ/RimL family protein N-acetyltransferase
MDPWPLRNLVLRTPRLELRPDDDPGLRELVDEARRGVHEPDYMPFTYPWTDDPEHTWLQYHWSMRAALSPAEWRLNFLVRVAGRVIGTQGMAATDFAVTRTAMTGSWLGRRHQGRGYGTEMRAAVAVFGFDWLGATRMMSEAFDDNHASLAVSRKLGYVPDGTQILARRDKPATNVRLLLTPDAFVRPDWRLTVSGLEPCLPFLVGTPAATP